MSNSDNIQGVPANFPNAINIQVDRTGSGDREVVELGIPGSTGIVLPALAQSGTAAVTSVAASASSVTLLAANANRRGVIIVNDSVSATLDLAYAGTASTSAYTQSVPPGATWEMPLPAYTGAISGIWSAAVGNARVTEE